MSSLVVDHVTKRYGAHLAVDGVSFEVQPGRIFGVLGPNGAGKTSTIRMIAYITTPDEGRVTFGGEPVGPETQRVMGYLPEERGLYRKMKVGEQLGYLGQLKGLSTAEASAAVRRWLDRFDATSWYGKRVEELSKGMQQKVQFIATILHEPQLLIFDEPFSGLDPINAALLKDIILELRAEGRTILFASHRMEQVEQLCDDIFLIANGREVLHGALRDVKRSFGKNTVTMEFSGDDGFLDQLEVEGAIRLRSRSSGHAEFRLRGTTTARRVLAAALPGVDEVYRFELNEPPLSEIFVMVVNGQTPATIAESAPEPLDRP
ncbi:MAG: ATP-binding cassette domain-containing protein [Rhodothermales bacterium]